VNWHIREAVRRLQDGGVIAYPTETVYGLGCDPLNATAVLHLISLKQRRIEQGLILVASHFEQLEAYLCPVPAAIRKRVTGIGKQPVTWVLPCHEYVPVWLRGDREVLFLHKDEIHLLDTQTGTHRAIYSLPGAPLGDLLISRDNRVVSFTRRTAEADIWMLSREP